MSPQTQYMQITEDSTEDDVSDELKNNKKEIVDNIAEETGLTGFEEREMIGRTVEQLHLDDKFADSNFQETDDLNPSLLESLLDGPKPSHGIAVVDEIRNEDGNLNINFQVKGTDNYFSRTFNVDELEGDDSSGLTGLFGNSGTDYSREYFEKLVLLTDGRISKPSTLVGEEVPVRPKKRSDGYRIDYPSEKPSFIAQSRYRVIRLLYDYNLISYNDDRGPSEMSHSPNRYLWGILGSIFVLLLLLPIPVTLLFSTMMAVFILICMGVLCINLIYLMDGEYS